MNDTYKVVRKAINIAVTSATVLWSVGAASFAPLAAHAATPGQLIKMSGSSSVYYLGTDMKRYVWPNEKTYKSWYADFSGVMTVSQSELQSYTIGPTLTMRGGTYLGKVTTDPKVYAVEPGGVLRWVQTEAIAKTLFGDNWASKVVDIPDAFFSDYTVGSPISTNAYPSGSLVKSANSSDIYYVDGSSKRKVTSSGLTRNWFNTAFVNVAQDTILNALSNGSDITVMETGLTNVTGGASTTPTGSGLTVALASDTPASGIIASGTAYNSVLKVNLTAAADGAVNVTSLTLTRMGISLDSDVSGVAVFDQNGVRHGNFVTFGLTKATIDMASNPIVVPAGQTVSATVKLNIASSVQSGTIAVGINSSADVKSTAAAVNGSFPVVGNGQSMISGSGVVGSLQVDVMSLTTTTIQVDIDTADYLLTKFRLTAGAAEDVKVNSIRAFVNGTVDDDDLQNYELRDPNGNVLSTLAKASGRYIDFVFATPYTVPEGNQRDLSLLVDVKDGSSRTAQVNIQNDYDVVAMGAETGSGILATAGGSGINDTSFPLGDITTGNAGFNQLTVQAGTLTVNKATSSPTGEIGVNTPNTVVATWDMQAKGEPIEIQRVDLDFGGTAVAGDLRGTIKLQTDAGQTLMSFAPDSTDGGELFDGDAVSTDSQTLSSYYTIPAGTTAKLKLVVDTDSDISSGDTIQGGIGAVYYKRVLTNNFNTGYTGSFVTGNTLTATTNALTVTTNAAFTSQTVTAGQTGLKVASFLLKTNNAEGVSVSSVAVTLAGGDSVAAVDLSNLMLKRADTNAQIGSTIASPALAANTFTVSGQLNIPANTTVQIDVYANIASGASDGGANDTLAATLASGAVAGVGLVSGSSIPTSSAATLQTMTFATSGTLAVTIDQSGAASSQFLSPSLAGVELARVKLAAGSEPVKLTKLDLRTINGSGNIDQVKLLGTGGASDPVTQLTSGVASFTFSSGNEITVNANSSRVLTVLVNTTPLQSVVAGNLGVVGFNTADAQGASSGSTIQESVTGTSYVAGTDAYSGDIGDIVYFTNTADAGTNTAPGYYMVTTDDDAVNLATGDLDLNGEATDTSFTSGDVVSKLTKSSSVAGNGNAAENFNVGDVVYVYDADDNEAMFAIVTTAVASGDAISGLGFSPAGSVAIAAAGDRVTRLTNTNALVGNTMRYEEVEPVVTLSASSPSGTTSPNSEQVVGIFNLKAEGGRDMTFNSLTVEKNGSNTPERYVSKLSLWNGSTKLAEVMNTTFAVVGDGANANADTSLILCTGADPAAGEIGGVTAAEAATLAVGDKITVRETAGGTASSTGTITAKTGTIGACGGVSTLTITADATLTITGAMTAASIDNNRVHFDANQSNTNDTALVEQTVTAGQTMTLTVKADTSSVKTGVTSGTVTFGVNVPGSNGPLQVGSTQIEGLNWDYTPLGTGTAAYKTEADNYPITGNTLTY